jgi:hypothetical protein
MNQLLCKEIDAFNINTNLYFKNAIFIPLARTTIMTSITNNCNIPGYIFLGMTEIPQQPCCNGCMNNSGDQFYIITIISFCGLFYNADRSQTICGRMG